MLKILQENLKKIVTNIYQQLIKNNKIQDQWTIKRSRLLQSIGENRIDNTPRDQFNTSVNNDLKYVKKFNPDLSMFSGGTIKANKGPSGPKNNIVVYQDSRRFIRQYDKPLKEQYFEKLGYIKSPINQVKIPEISLSKRSY